MKAFLLAAAFAVTASAALAAAAPTPPPELEAARKALATAVEARDRKAVVAVSRFPLAFSGYEAPETISEKEFLTNNSRFEGLFFGGDTQLVSCLRAGKLEHQAKPDFPGSPWLIDCNGNLYYFGLVGGKWRFTSYMNINE
jgi:hypothetical protein